MTLNQPNMWEYGQNPSDWNDEQLVGYKVEAADGEIGKIDEASAETGAQRIVVDTGPWIFGQKVLLPAGVVDRVDHDEQKVFVTVTKDAIKGSPKFDETSANDMTYRESVGTYYGTTLRR